MPPHDTKNSGQSSHDLPAMQVSPRKLSTLVADEITDHILRSGLKPGSRLPPEAEMRELLGVGRGTVREAMRVLEAEGLVVVRSGQYGGPFVERPDLERMSRHLLLLMIFWEASLSDVYEVRAMLEPLAAQLAAEHATESEVDEINSSVGRMLAEINNEESFVEENQIFHYRIAQAGRNPVLSAFVGAIVRSFDGYAMGGRFTVKARKAAAQFHAEIAQAIAARDGEAARRMTLAHIEDAVAFFRASQPSLLSRPIRPTLLSQSRGARQPEYPWNDLDLGTNEEE
jgi:GntR family transcriptional regulator, transcriptional repressor for pyruvate dehydrogenase complex